MIRTVNITNITTSQWARLCVAVDLKSEVASSHYLREEIGRMLQNI